ncbi:uncharacterized protein UV8b_07417 [Ustilaginoidea virens]|uniref:Uncharacterized protein n=1 Tax=Ustilaginoidea virens TaxID=1159556 RepID=A0A8E5MKL0_USTVR|nr:uncharacterized protein UV8b_07417 [Ustilaginoidea virens]QUC23176.1 hypothetical protein UV8b_07417 [Ustilaginoidea virens]
MAMNSENPLPQPNFGLISEGFGSLSEQFALCANLPAVNNGDRLVTTLQTILNRLVQLNEKADALDRKVEDLRSDMSAERRNAIARLQNSSVMSVSEDLVALHNPATGALINNFPPTLGHLDRLEMRQVNELLQQLGEVGTGRIDERRRHLMRTIGVLARKLR